MQREQKLIAFFCSQQKLLSGMIHALIFKCVQAVQLLGPVFGTRPIFRTMPIGLYRGDKFLVQVSWACFVVELRLYCRSYVLELIPRFSRPSTTKWTCCLLVGLTSSDVFLTDTRPYTRRRPLTTCPQSSPHDFNPSLSHHDLSSIISTYSTRPTRQLGQLDLYELRLRTRVLDLLNLEYRSWNSVESLACGLFYYNTSTFLVAFILVLRSSIV